MCSRGAKISLHAKGLQGQTTAQVDVVLPENFTIAANSEVEVMGIMPVSCEGVWMVETKPLKKPQVMVARAIVTPKDRRIPIHMLNMDCHLVTIYKGTKIACAEAIDNIREIFTVGGAKNQPTCTEQGQAEVLNNILSVMTETLNGYQLKQFCALIMSFSHIFALKPDDLGRTNLLKCRIETSGTPIRQGVR